MNCNIPIEKLNAYIDNELSKEEKQMIEKHLKRCKKCKKRIEELKSVDKYIKKYTVEEPTNEFKLGLASRVISEVKIEKRKLIVRWVIIPVSISLLIFVFLINYYFNISYKDNKKNMPSQAIIGKGIKIEREYFKEGLKVGQAEKDILLIKDFEKALIDTIDTTFIIKKKSSNLKGKEIKKFER